jgi:glycosyltransferase involved in cell wall biosynthesis
MAAHRPYSWAKYWTLDGHDVTVLTSKKATSFDDLPFDTTFCKVIQAPWLPDFLDVFTKRSAAGPSVTANEQSTLRQLSSAMITKLIRTIAPIQQKYGIFYAQRFPDVFMFWRFKAMKALSDEKEWDVVVSTHGPYATHLLAYKLKKQGRAKRWIADYRDLWVGNFPYPGIWPFRLYESALERKILRLADAGTTANDSFSEKLSERHPDLRIHTIENGFEPADIDALPIERYFPEDGIFRIVYTGWMHELRDPSILFKAVSRLHDEFMESDKATPEGLGLRIVFAGPFSQVVQDRAQEAGIAAYVQQIGMVSRSEALRMQRDAHALFFMEWKANGESIFSGKIFEYISSGTEIWATGGPLDTSVRDLITQSRTGIHFADNLDMLVDIARARLGAKGKPPVNPDVDYLFQYTRQSKAQTYCNILKAIEGSEAPNV